MRESLCRWALCGAVLLPIGANAALDVLVIEARQGTPVANAAVCLGTAADPVQFGAARTDTLGRASFENLPRYGVQATVSAQGFQGRRQPLNSRQNHRLTKIALLRGGLGPECLAPALASKRETAEQPSSVSIEQLQIRQVGSQLQLHAKTAGAPNQIRVGSAAAFDQAEWQALQMPLKIKRPPQGGPLLVQVRRATQKDGILLSVESAIMQHPLP